MSTAHDPVSELAAAVVRAAEGLVGGPLEDVPSFERPPESDLGDYSTNVAMALAPVLRASPQDNAARLTEALGDELGGDVERIEVAGPGFVNVFLSPPWYRRALAGILAAGEGYGAGVAPSPEDVLVEFVSANPTGPLTAAGGRHAAFGDALARVLEHAGHRVEREYYVNDHGSQMRLFAESIAARMTGTAVPEGGYEGSYVTELATELAADGASADDVASLERLGTVAMVERVRDTLERFGVIFDGWVSERALHEAGRVDAVLEVLAERGHTYESDGALWLRSTSFGDDKDRVLRRAGGETTYLAADVAYHEEKLERGDDRLIDVWGADHHGYVSRLRASIAALGADPERLEIVIMQLVNVLERGERAQMSKRKGEFVTLDEVIDDIGTDAARFFLLQRSQDTALDLDLDLARQQSRDNPVYYVQYAHARICSILRRAEERGGSEGDGALAAAVEGLPAEPAERVLVKRLLELPGEVREAADRRAPHRLTTYGIATAADFHAFYRDCRVVGADGEGVEEARLALCVATRSVIARTLGLLGVSAPESM